ncbi:MAG: hypothetical protein KBG80_00035 [Breznakibacter sp.]|nr:hypothetical protein [Breznakibacter sp.]
MRKRYLLLIALSFFALTRTFAQLAPPFIFSDDPQRFQHQLDSIMSQQADKKTVSEFQKSFNPFWEDPYVPVSQRQMMIGVVNALSKRRAKVFPDYVNYFETLMAFSEKGHVGDSWANWNNAIKDLISNSKTSLRVINDLFQTTQEILYKNIVFSTSAIKWNGTSKDFRFEYDKDTPFKVVFGKMQLSCVALNGDSITIFDTQGELNMITNIWRGKQGRITWEACGYSASDVNATFKAYQLDLTKSHFELDSVEFVNRKYFDYSLKGKLSHKVLHISSPDGAIYPQFTSYDLRYVLKDIFKNVDYEGGFSQHGAKVLGSGSGASPAMIRIFRNDTCFVEAKSKYFSLRKDLIQSSDAEVRIFLAETNVYHPGLIFKYNDVKREVELIRDGEGLALCPYFDKFHNVSLDVEVIHWRISEPFMNLRGITGAAQNQAFFESLSYYREEYFDQLQGLDREHPLQGLKKCSAFYGDLPFTVEEYAYFMKLPVNQIRQQIILLSFNGFVGYNAETDVIEVKDRLSDYLLFRTGKKDYDVIKFNSVTAPTVSNAVLNLYNYDLSLNGVSSISICDHQNIVFFPQEEKIILKRNRNFVFGGTINAGMLNLFGDGFEFDYDDFKINLTNIDSLRMKVLSGGADYYGRPELKNIQNSIAKLSGVLRIDKKDNKSGTKRYGNYPILTSTKESYVYYDKKFIQDGAYKRDKFYFKLDTFQLDSINMLTRNNFSFKGSFTSNIFPEFEEKLVVRKDYSLGFVRTTPAEGFPIYGNRAKYYSDIDLSNEGFLGKGKLTYQTSTSNSERFVFLPERTYGLTQTFEVEKRAKGVEFPDAKGKYNTIDFLPYEDQLIAKSQENSFEMFNREGLLEGHLTLSSSGAVGGGKMMLPSSTLEAEKMSFGDHTIHSDSADFKMMGADLQNISFATTDLIADIDFEKRMGQFTSLVGGSRVDFTDNKYISFIREFSWNMDKNYIFLGAKGSKGNRFVSVHRKQDSLEFLAPLARYDLGAKLIEAVDVKSINVADATVYIPSGVVRIRENADMDPLDSVRIEMRDTLYHHKIYNAKVKILGKYAYSGSGVFDFVNGDDKVIPIDLGIIGVDKEIHTIGYGTIPPTALLPLDSHFSYKGDVKFTSNLKDLSYDGGVQMIHNYPQGPRSFLLFNAEVDPKNIMIPIAESPQSFEKESVFRDIFMTKDSIHIYSSFIEGRSNYSDIPMLTAKGSLFYNKATGGFGITSEAKIANPDTTGVYMEFSSKTGDVRGEGDFNIGIEFDRVKTRSSGTIIDNRKNDKVFMSSMLGVDFYLTEPLVTLMVNDIAKAQGKESKLSAETFTKRIAEWVGKSQAVKINAKRSTFDLYKDMPIEANYMLNFGNIDLTWNTPKKSFIADGTFDLSFIQGYPINRQVDVKAQFTRSRAGNFFDIYIGIDENTWYYFSYRNGLMMTYSSNSEYNSLVQTTKTDDRKLKAGIGEKSYSFILAPQNKKDAFLKKIKVKEAVVEQTDDDQIEIDTDGDGKPEGYDTDGDGKIDKKIKKENEREEEEEKK